LGGDFAEACIGAAGSGRKRLGSRGKKGRGMTKIRGNKLSNFIEGRLRRGWGGGGKVKEKGLSRKSL